MVNSEPLVKKENHYDLQETARLLEVSSSTISRWTAQGKMCCKVLRVNHRRVWTGAEILKIWRLTY